MRTTTIALFLLVAFAGVADSAGSLEQGYSLATHGCTTKYTVLLPVETKVWGSAAVERNAATALCTIQVQQGLNTSGVPVDNCITATFTSETPHVDVHSEWPEFCNKHEHHAPAVPKISKTWETSSLKGSCDVWASRQLGPPGLNGELNASPPWRTPSTSIPFGSKGLVAALGAAWPGRDAAGNPAVGVLQQAFVCLRIRRCLEHPGTNPDKGCCPRAQLAAEVAAVRNVLATHDSGPVGFSIVGE
ncbi:hypothetical protein FOA52_005840 [Chlamydomonas sp. UWO 241]|nr:hypothetical protein FOA52_005840 [Chlamydomonas sp. UWO 241]